MGEICSECGNEFSMEFRNVNDYVYKAKTRNKSGNVRVVYQCCYTCYRKAWKREKEEFIKRKYV